MATNIPLAPNYSGNIALRSNPVTFPQDAEDQYTYLSLFSVDWNVTITAMNTAIGETEGFADASEASSVSSAVSASESAGFAGNSASSANMVGNWGDQAGSATKPLSVVHVGNTWLLLNDLADITLNEPGQTSDWFNADSTKRITHNRFLHFYRNR